MKENVSHSLTTCLLAMFLGIISFPAVQAQTTYSQSSGTTTKTGQTYSSATTDLSVVNVTSATSY